MKIGRERKVASEHVESDLRYHRQRSPMSPSIYIIAGPDGVGKTTFAREFLPNYANCRHFISADPIAVALSRIKGRYFDASLVGETTPARFDGNPRLSVLSELVPVQDPDSFPQIPNAIGNANCDILTVKRGGKDGAF
jgi:DNA polymerase III delta prime subunit